MDERTVVAQAGDQHDPLVYQIRTLKPPIWYDFAPLGSVILMTVAVVIICIWLLLDSNLLPRIFSVICLIMFFAYVSRFLYHFLRSRKLVTKEAVLTDTDLTVINDIWTKQFKLEDVVFTMSYSSSTNLCIIVATREDYLTINCSCGFLLSKDGKEALRPFYALNKRFMQWNPNHYNYIRNKRYRKKNPYKIPLYVFEIEYDTARVTRFIDSLRTKYPFDWAQRCTVEEEREA